MKSISLYREFGENTVSAEGLNPFYARPSDIMASGVNLTSYGCIAGSMSRDNCDIPLTQAIHGVFYLPPLFSVIRHGSGTGMEWNG